MIDIVISDPIITAGKSGLVALEIIKTPNTIIKFPNHKVTNATHVISKNPTAAIIVVNNSLILSGIFLYPLVSRFVVLTAVVYVVPDVIICNYAQFKIYFQHFRILNGYPVYHFLVGRPALLILS